MYWPFVSVVFPAGQRRVTEGSPSLAKDLAPMHMRPMTHIVKILLAFQPPASTIAAEGGFRILIKNIAKKRGEGLVAQAGGLGAVREPRLRQHLPIEAIILIYAFHLRDRFL